MTDKLPEGWAITRFGDLLLDAQNGCSARSGKGQPTVVLRLADVSTEGHIAQSGLRTIPLPPEARKKYALRGGDLLAFRVNGSASIVGQVICYRGEADYTYCDHFIRFRSDPDALDPSFAAYAFRAEGIRGQVERYIVNSAGQNTVSQASFRDVELLLPPLAEQRRIVTKLEVLLAEVNATRDHLTKVPAILKRFRQSVLAAACSGRLTADWREENPKAGDASSLVADLQQTHEAAGGHKQGNAAPPTDEAHDLTSDELPPTWGLTEMRTAVCPDRPITYGILKPGPDTTGGIPYIRVADFPNDRLNLATIRRTTKEIESAYARARLREGDILLSIRGTVGRVCVVPRELENANITQDTARLSIQPMLNRDFVTWFLRASPTQKRMQKAVKGVAVRGINIGDVRALQLPVPPLPEQLEIVRRVEGLFALADDLEDRFANAKAQVDRFTPSLLARAFRGELVPTEAELAKQQGCDYESAAALLERIRGERAAGAAERTGRPNVSR